jgi:predicted porin
MKKNFLALAVLGAFAGAASAQTNVSIYGVVDAGINFKDNGAATNAKTWGVDSGMQSGSRLGFKGSEDLGGGLSANFARAQARFHSDVKKECSCVGHA